MDKRTVSSAHSRIDDLNVTFASLRTEVTIQHKELFTRVKRLEAIMIGASAWVTYRTALRDITAHANWPNLTGPDIDGIGGDWPTEPS
tara:strand:- start:311 stop:574 length:264 start_codon:yes stop_codon:yes gene_type:complete